jgi:metal-responsive CopG/Arc/MetJ family transcriptional regulator
MKTAISLPDALYAQADKYAQDNGLSRSSLVAVALREYLGQHKHLNLTEQLNEAIDAQGQPTDETVLAYNRRKMRSAEW